MASFDMKLHGLLLGFCSLVLVCCQTTSERPETRPLGEPLLTPQQFKASKSSLSFIDHVKPILEGRCLHCHNGKEMPGKFSLVTKDEAFAGSRIVPGDAQKSLVFVVLKSGNHAMAMPAVGMAPPSEEVDVLRRWIDGGANWPDGVRLQPSESD